MEYCPYGQLYEVLRGDTALPVSLLLDWAKQIADGMNYLHNHKIIHRDLKSPKYVILSCNMICDLLQTEMCKQFSFASSVTYISFTPVKK